MVISIVGLRMLAKMKEEERPKDWKEEVLNYLQFKEDSVIKHNRPYALMQFAEALELSSSMGIAWNPKF